MEKFKSLKLLQKFLIKNAFCKKQIDLLLIINKKVFIIFKSNFIDKR